MTSAKKSKATPRAAKAAGSPTSSRSSAGIIEILRARFEANMQRHPGVEWSAIAKRLEASPKTLATLAEMERTGGEPDVVRLDPKSKELRFVDCSPETPNGRRSLCYDREARITRREAPPAGSALEMASAMGIEILTVEQYRALQEVGEFDLKTSSWVETPPAIRALGGALFGDRRYDTVFIYHNGAQSYYAARAFRGSLPVNGPGFPGGSDS